jgi:hypothetical protein
MPIERRPENPVPDPHIPEKSYPYRVGPTDDWYAIARKFRLSAAKLIHFNFQTNNPDEVNWYLRRRTGCLTPTSDGKNWMFKGARPGIIYIPEGATGFHPSEIPVTKDLDISTTDLFKF